MSIPFRALLAAGAVALSATVVLAAASNMPTNYQPDPALKTENLGQLRARVSQACGVIQARAQGVSEISVSRKCDCYAAQTLRALNPEEMQAYRDTGVFNNTARDKALTSLDSCKLQRPVL